MLKEIVVIAAFLLALSGVMGSIVYVQIIAEKQDAAVNRIIGEANEAY